MTKNNDISKKIPLKINPYLVIVIALVSVIVLILNGRRSYEDTYDAYIEATMARDAEAVVDLLHDSYIDRDSMMGDIDLFIDARKNA